MEIRRVDKKVAAALLAKHFHLNRRGETLWERFLTALRRIF